MDAAIAARKATAERNALLGLAAILTHDLSNPLQSITVLCELGMDDDDPAEGPRRAEQCLEAGERMRVLIHSYAALVRSVGQTSAVASTVERILPLFLRRFERHRITLSSELADAGEGPPDLGLAVLRVLLGIVHIAGAGSAQHHTVSLKTFERRVDVALVDGAGGAVGWAEEVVEDVEAMLANAGKVVIEGATLSIRLEGVAA